MIIEFLNSIFIITKHNNSKAKIEVEKKSQLILRYNKKYRLVFFFSFFLSLKLQNFEN